MAGAQQSQLHQDQQQQQHQQSIETLARSGNESDSLQNIDKIETVGDSEPRPKRDYRHRQRHRHSSSEFGSMPFESGLRGFKFHEEFLNFRQNFFDGRQLFFGSNSDNNASKRKRWRLMHESNFCIFTANIKNLALLKESLRTFNSGSTKSPFWFLPTLYSMGVKKRPPGSK